MVHFKHKYLPLKEAAKLFGYNPDYIGCLIRKGKIPGKKVCGTTSWQLNKQSIIEYCQERKILALASEVSAGRIGNGCSWNESGGGGRLSNGTATGADQALAIESQHGSRGISFTWNI